MNRLSLLSFAAVAALAATPVIAQAQGHGGRAGASWQGGGMRTGGGFRAGGGMNVRHGGGVNVRTGGRFRAGGGVNVRHGGGVNVRHGGGVNVRHGGANVVVRHHNGGNFNYRHGSRFHPGRNFPRRIHRGANIHPYWFGQQFHINNWQMYGFAQPGADQRWVRYYDDAYLIDRGGRVVDQRQGLDWDEYGERWSEEDGVPSYYGSREYTPGEEDYAWAEEHREQGEEDWDYAEEDADGRPGGPPPGYGHGPAQGGPPPGHGYGHVQGGPPPGYGHGPVQGAGYGYGAYGYGWAYPIVIETTVTTGGGYTEEITEEVVEVRRAHRQRRPSCNCRRPAPARHAPPPAGERG